MEDVGYVESPKYFHKFESFMGYINQSIPGHIYENFKAWIKGEKQHIQKLLKCFPKHIHVHKSYKR